MIQQFSLTLQGDCEDILAVDDKDKLTMTSVVCPMNAKCKAWTMEPERERAASPLLEMR